MNYFTTTVAVYQTPTQTDDAARLLHALHAGSDGAAYLWLKGAGENTGCNRTLWFDPGADLPALPPGEWNVYFGVNPAVRRGRSSERASIGTVGSLVALYADMDGYHSDDGLSAHFAAAGVPQPSATVYSGGGFHTYWLLTEPLPLDDASNRATARAVQRAWVHRVGGDIAASCIARVLRLPGTVNHKPGRNGAEVELVSLDSDRRFDFADLAALSLPGHSAPEAPSLPDSTQTTASDGDVIAGILRGPGTAALWSGDVSGYPSPSEADAALCVRLAHLTGCDPDQMDRLFRQSGLYRPKWERPDYRQRTIERAIVHYTATYDPSLAERRSEDDLVAELTRLADFALSDGFAYTVRHAGATRIEAARQSYVALINLARREGRLTGLTPGVRALAAEAGLGKSAVHNNLALLQKAGLVDMPPREKGEAAIISLVPGFRPATGEASIPPSSIPPVEETVHLTNDFRFYATHLADDAFTVPHWTHTQRREAAGLAIEEAFGPTARLVVDAVMRGSMTQQGMVTATGAAAWSVGEARRRLERAGVIVVVDTTGKTGRVKVYGLADDDLAALEARLDALRPNMKTAGLGLARAYRMEVERAAWYDRQVRENAASGCEPGERASLLARRDRAIRLAAAHLDSLRAMGIDLHGAMIIRAGWQDYVKVRGARRAQSRAAATPDPGGPARIMAVSS